MLSSCFRCLANVGGFAAVSKRIKSKRKIRIRKKIKSRIKRKIKIWKCVARP
jgi:hypothetical protein